MCLVWVCYGVGLWFARTLLEHSQFVWMDCGGPLPARTRRRLLRAAHLSKNSRPREPPGGKRGSQRRTSPRFSAHLGTIYLPPRSTLFAHSRRLQGGAPKRQVRVKRNLWNLQHFLANTSLLTFRSQMKKYANLKNAQKRGHFTVLYLETSRESQS